MKKGLSVVLTIVYILMIVGGIELLIFSSTYRESTPKIKEISKINISDITDYTTLYIENLEIIERYAFKTEDEYKDSEGTYTEINYYVYDAMQPMDDNELSSEYYIVKFKDKSGKEYVSSLSVSADKTIAKKLKNCPLSTSACVGAAPISSNKLLNSYDVKLSDLRDSALTEYANNFEVTCANITLGYQNETIEQYQTEFQKDVTSAKIISLIFGLVLLSGGIYVMMYVRKKKKLNNPSH